MSYYESPSDLYGKSFGSGSPDVTLPKMRSDLVIRRQVHQKEVYYIVKDPPAMAYFNFPPSEHEILTLFDGKRTDEEIIDEYNRRHPLEIIDEDGLAASKAGFREMELLEIPPRVKNLMLMERIRAQRQLRKKATEGDIFYMTFSAWDPDRIFNRVIPYLRFFWTREFLLISAVCILMMLGINYVKWEEFKQGTIELYSFSNKSLWEVFVFIFLMTATGTVHELAHGLTLKNYGGEVHQVGFLLFYLTPAFYADVSDSYILPRKERLWTTLAGTYAELMLCSIASFVWYFAVPGTLIYYFAFQVILFTGISSFLINMNPLIKLDGYFILMDTLEIPDLREESFSFVVRWVKKNVFGLQVEEEEQTTRRRRRIFITYAFFAMLYTLTIYLLVVIWIRNIYLNSFGRVGYFLFLVTVYFLFRKEIKEIFQFGKFVYLDKKEVLMKKKPAIWIGGGIALILLLVFPAHTKISSAFVVEPSQRVEVRAGTDGFIDQVLVRESDSVQPGQVLVRMKNRDMDLHVMQISSGLEQRTRTLYALQSLEDKAEYQMRQREQKQLLEQKTELDRKIGQLVLKSPIRGTVMTPRVDELTGTYVEKGVLVCVIGSLDRVRIQIPVQEYAIEDISVGREVVLKLDAYPTKTYPGVVAEISSAGTERVDAIEGSFAKFMVTVLIENQDRRLVPGMRGDAKILGPRYPTIWRMGREVRRWIQSRVW